MNKLARHGFVILILVFLFILGANFVLADGCCRLETNCIENYGGNKNTCESQNGEWDADPTCDGISGCNIICCCEGTTAHPNMRRVACANIGWQQGPKALSSDECNTYCLSAPTKCSDVGVCASENTCAGNRYQNFDNDCTSPTPYCCETAASAYVDCCEQNEICNGVTLTDNYYFCNRACSASCESILTGSISGYVYNTTQSNKISNARVYAELVSQPNVEVKSTTTNASGEYVLTDLPYNTYKIYAEKEGFVTNYIQQDIGGNIGNRHINLIPIYEEACDSDNPPAVNVFNANPIKGKKAVALTWENPCPSKVVGYSIWREPWHYLGTFYTSGTSFIDEDVEWSNYNRFSTDIKTYKYHITAIYISGRESSEKSTSITMGHYYCEGIFNDEEFCLNSNQIKSGELTERYACNDDNTLKDLQDSCSPSVCIGPGEDGKTYCKEKTNCVELGNPFGLFYTQDSCLSDDKYCYYDYSNTTIDYCGNCTNVKSCYNYRSEDACLKDNCGAGGIYVGGEEGYNQGCKWIGLWEEFGKGICYDPDYRGVDRCSLCGLEGDVFYNTGCNQVVCSALGSCYTNSSGSCSECVYEGDKTECRDFTTEEACIGGQEINFKDNNCVDGLIEIIPSNDACELGVCKWDGVGCYKDANDDDIDDCRNSPTPGACNQDMEAPITIPQTDILNMGISGYYITFTADADAVKFYYCVGEEDCCPRMEKNFTGTIKSVEINPSFYLPGDIVAGVYYIRYYSIDKHYNIERVKSLPFYIDKTYPKVNLSYTTQKIGGILSLLAIKLKSDEFITCSYSINPNPGNPTKNDLVPGNINKALELEFQNINDTNYDLTTTCKDSVGNEDIHTWNLLSPFNVMIYKDSMPVSEIGVGVYTIKIKTSQVFNSLNVSYNFSRPAGILVKKDVVMSKIGTLLWEGTFTIFREYRNVNSVFKIGVIGKDTGNNIHTIINTDYRINTIGPSITFKPELIEPRTVYTSSYPISGYTGPGSIVWVNVYSCTSPTICSYEPHPFSDVSESDIDPVKIINMQIEKCKGVYPGQNDAYICFSGDLTTDPYYFDPKLPGSPIYYLEFTPSHGRRYRVEDIKVVQGIFGDITYVFFTPGLKYPLSGAYNVSTYTSEYPPGWFEVPVSLSIEGLNKLEIFAIKDEKVGDIVYHLVNYNETGLSIVQKTPQYNQILYNSSLQSIKVEVTTNFAANCRIINPQDNRVAKQFNYLLTSSSDKKTHSIIFDKNSCSSPIGSGPFCYLNNDGSRSDGIYHKYQVDCTTDEIEIASASKEICFGVATWYEMGGTQYGVNICNGATNCNGVFPLGCGQCTPNCINKICGQSDGCGGICTACPSGKVCENGQCIICTPNCAGKQCDDDGCGGSCGTCQSGMTCESGQCKWIVGGEHD